MGKFILTSEYKPTGDQPEAIRELTEGLDRGDRAQVLLGVTGSGKTFTMANVIAQSQQDAGTSALYGNEGILPSERRRILCQLL